jgi:hypothetical protein
MRKREILLFENKMLKVNSTWILSIKSYLDQFEDDTNLHNLENLDITIKSNSFWELDNIWCHYIYLLSSRSNSKTVIYFNPHQWFFVLRKSSEILLFKHFKKMGARVFQLISGSTKLDNDTIFEIKNSQKVRASRMYDWDPSIYVNVIGNAVITVKLPKELYLKIDEWYFKTQNKTDLKLQELIKLVNCKTKKSISMRIKYSKELAEKYRKIASKYIMID